MREQEGRYEACPCRDLMGLARCGLASFSRLDTRHHCRHPVVQTCCWRGALRGGTPRTREGRRPDRPELQLSVVSG